MTPCSFIHAATTPPAVPLEPRSAGAKDVCGYFSGGLA